MLKNARQTQSLATIKARLSHCHRHCHKIYHRKIYLKTTARQKAKMSQDHPM